MNSSDEIREMIQKFDLLGNRERWAGQILAILDMLNGRIDGLENVTQSPMDTDRFKTLEEALAFERELCKRDVCMYCGGRARGYERAPVGPNSADNWVHYRTDSMDEKDGALCVASSVFAREKFAREQT